MIRNSMRHRRGLAQSREHGPERRIFGRGARTGEGLGACPVEHRVGCDLRVGGDVAVGAGTYGTDTVLQGGVEADSKALIVDLPSPGKGEVPEIEYVVGLANFLSIVNYNRSYFYAQSVAEFAEALGYSNKSVFPVQEQSTSKPVKEQ